MAVAMLMSLIDRSPLRGLVRGVDLQVPRLAASAPPFCLLGQSHGAAPGRVVGAADTHTRPFTLGLRA